MAAAPKIAALSDAYLDHRFDVLGSGWVQVRHGMTCAGVEGHRYESGEALDADRDGVWLGSKLNAASLTECRRIWRLIDRGDSSDSYRAIDWQLDFKSGHRWSERTWYLDIAYGHVAGADIRVPWELAHMHHLTQFAWAYGLARRCSSGFAASEVYLREFRNQLLDFIASNPPRFGVNWRCTMDVAVRVANWLVAYDLFNSFGARFDEAFSECFARSIYQHAVHIAGNLEWSPRVRTSHYLADIAGLLFASAYLASTRETDAWLLFAIQQLIVEVENQFTNDGANCEASTSYHCLSAEIVTFATALAMRVASDYKHRLHRIAHASALSIPHALKPALAAFDPLSAGDSIFPEWYFERLEKMAEFAIDFTKPSGRIVQIGDHDSARFLKLDPSGAVTSAGVWQEDHLDRRHLVSAINGIARRDDFTCFAGEYTLDSEVVRELAKRSRPAPMSGDRPRCASRVRIGDDATWSCLNSELLAMPDDRRLVSDIPLPGAFIRSGLTLAAYPQFGLFIFRSARIYLAVRCGPVGQNGNGGHAHHDELSLEFNLDGDDVLADSGSYLYTPLPHRRDEYRSVRAHFGPRLLGRPAEGFEGGLFTMLDPPVSQCLYFGERGFIGTVRHRRHLIYRVVRLADDGVTITDACKSSPLEKLVFSNRCRFSPGYGILAQ